MKSVKKQKIAYKMQYQEWESFFFPFVPLIAGIFKKIKVSLHYLCFWIKMFEVLTIVSFEKCPGLFHKNAWRVHKKQTNKQKTFISPLN